MAALTNVMENIVILDDDDDAKEPSASTSSVSRPRPPAPGHIAVSPFASAKKESHVLKLENEKLFTEFVDHCVEHTQNHPEVLSFLKTKYSKAMPDFLQSVEFRNAVGRCLTQAQTHQSKTFVYINELCTILKKHSAKRRATIQPYNGKEQEKTPSGEGEEKTNTALQEDSASKPQEGGQEEVKTRRASRRQIAYLENLLKVYSDEIKRLQERDLSLEDLEKEDSSYIQEHKLKRKLMKIYDKLCELKNCSTLTGRVIEQRICYSGTRHPEINKKIERFINQAEVLQNPPDYRDILQVVKRVNERSQLLLSHKQLTQIAQEAFREVGSKLQERRHLDMVYNFGSHITDSYRPTFDPALSDPMLSQKLRANREVALNSLEEVINKYANKQEDTEEEERRKRLGKEKEKKENGQQDSAKAENCEKSGEENEEEDEEEGEEADEEEEEEEEEVSSDPDIEEEIQASTAVRPGDDDDDEEREEEGQGASDGVMQPGSDSSCPSVKSAGGGDAGESGDEVPLCEDRTGDIITAHKPLEDKPPIDSPSSSNSHALSDVPNPLSGEDASYVSNSCSSADVHCVGEAVETPSPPENRVSTPVTVSTCAPEGTDETLNTKKRKRKSKKNHTIVPNGSIKQSDVSGSDVSLDKVDCSSPVQVVSTRADTPTQDTADSSRSSPPIKKQKVSVATQCDPDEVIVLSDSD